MTDSLNRYYDTYDEETRLTRDNLHQIEYRTTLRFLEKHIPPHSAVLDSCAGTGAYAFPLAEAGHVVTAGDIVPRHVARMREKDAGNLREIYEGDAADLSRFGADSFDAVLCLGALYHLRGDAAERAVAEGARVLKRGGVFAMSYINHTGVYFAQLMRAIRKEETAARVAAYRLLDQIESESWDGLFHGMTMDEATSLAAYHGIESVEVVSTYPVYYNFYNEINDMTEDAYEAYLACHFETCTDPAVARHAMHGLLIGRKKE